MRRSISIVVGLLAAISLLCSCSSQSAPDIAESTATTQSETCTEETFIEKTTEPPTEEHPEPPTEAPKGSKDNPYTDGMYKVGQDLPAGEYLILVVDNTGYYCVSSDSNKNDIIDNDIFGGHSFVTVKEGQYLDVSGCLFVVADEYTIGAQSDGSISEGMYRVGVDIVAGEYKLTSTDGSGYYAIYNSSIAPLDIVDNNLFSTNSYVTVSDGQYIKISGCTATLVSASGEKTATVNDLLSVIRDNLNYNNLSVTEKDGVIFIEYWMDGLSASIEAIKAGDTDKESLWNSLIDAEKKQCSRVMEALESLGMDYSVSWNILNDKNKESSLLTIVDGVVTYNAAE